ncbi:MAG: DUF6297 family protein [Ilumatobacteraceae bacterium]
MAEPTHGEQDRDEGEAREPASAMPAAEAGTSTGVAALRDLRRRRQLHRLGNLDWFEAAYRVYLFGFFGGGAVLWLSSSVKDEPVSAALQADILRHGPSVLGLLVAVAFMAGVRGGAQGGPLALEAADVTYIMLAPIDRLHALMRPAAQRLRSALFSGALAGGIVGQLAGRRLPGGTFQWFCSGALYGMNLAAVWVGAALFAHVVRMPRWMATLFGLIGVGWQAAAIAWGVPGAFNLDGSLALWGWRVHPVDLLAVAVSAAVVVFGITQLRRISLDALARRSALVAQLRFAVTMQDLRTVILLRRQLNQEHSRRRPYIRMRPAGPGTGLTASIWRRGWHGLLRFPVPRLVRMAALAATMGVLQAMVIRGTTPAFLATAIIGFVLGMEASEPLSQEVDQADRADALPIERGELMSRHLLAPAVMLIPFGLIAGLVAYFTLGANSDALVPALILCVPNVLGGATGGVISIVRDMPDPSSATTQQAFMPPEMVGFTSALRIAWPILVSAAGVSTVLLVRVAMRLGDSLTGAAIRGALGSLLIVVLVHQWVRLRDRLRRRIREFMEEGRNYTAQQRSSA